MVEGKSTHPLPLTGSWRSRISYIHTYIHTYKKKIEITVPLDTNLKKAYKDKQEKYIPLITNMQRVHRRYKYETVIITMGAMGAVPQSLEENLKKLNFAQDRIKTVTERMQKAALIGTMKICKTVMGM